VTGPLVVVGDALLDIDLNGRAGRLSPDAPVPVLDSLVESARPGGAGLAAELAARDGNDVVLVTALGDDAAGLWAVELLSPRVRVVTLGYDGDTPVKQRVRAAGQSLLRLDSGDRRGTVAPTAAQLDEAGAALDAASAVLVADYGRGVTAVDELRRLLERASRAPLVWDPHPRGSAPVHGARLVTPNRAEARELAARAGVEDDGPDGLAALNRHASRLVHVWRAHGVCVTLGADGALLSDGTSSPVLVPSPAVTCVDACGAGDRFAVAATAALAAGALPSEAVQEAVVSAARFVSRGGAAAVGLPAPGGWTGPRVPPDGATRSRPGAQVVVATGGCFDLLHAGHVATLRAARALGDRLVVCLNSDDSVRRLKGPTRPLVPAEDRARVLQALEYVDEVVVFDEDTPVEVLRRIRPDVWAKGGDYAGADVPEAAVMAEWGGQAVVLPYLDGRSTSRLVATAASTPGARA
jgi:D-beta-D-heptose 7-phosphate kinase / D-beta-D-heptose 1-phosphate adenosyltransferase